MNLSSAAPATIQGSMYLYVVYVNETERRFFGKVENVTLASSARVKARKGRARARCCWCLSPRPGRTTLAYMSCERFPIFSIKMAINSRPWGRSRGQLHLLDHPRVSCPIPGDASLFHFSARSPAISHKRRRSKFTRSVLSSHIIM